MLVVMSHPEVSKCVWLNTVTHLHVAGRAYLYHVTRLRQLPAIDISLLWVPILLLQRWWWAKIVAAQMITAHTGSGPLECLCKKSTKEVYAFSP